MRIVLDTDVFVSALISKTGPPGRLLEAARRGRFTLVTSARQIEELRSVFERRSLKPYIRASEVEALFDDLETVAVVVADLPDIALSPDPGDNPILATGVAGQVAMIVSGDKSHMLALGHVEGVPIVTPRDAVRQLRRTAAAKGVHEPKTAKP